MKRLLLAALAAFSVSFCYAQRETGLADEDARYDSTSLILLPSSKADLPRRVDLSPYCPMAKDQGRISSCVGWAVGYGLMTIETAIQNHETDTRAITENAFSAMFVYNQVKGDVGDCKRASVMREALEFLQEKGNCYAREFDFKVEDCYARPQDKLKAGARNNAIAGFSRLFDEATAENIKIESIRRVLAQNKPVSVGVLINNQFMTLRETDYWNPSLSKKPDLAHAMVIVGYDDDASCFTLFNSWGKSWGQNGFIKVSYKDIGQYCRFAFAIQVSKNSNAVQPFTMTDNGMQRPPRQGLVAQTASSNPSAGNNNNQTGRNNNQAAVSPSVGNNNNQTGRNNNQTVVNPSVGNNNNQNGRNNNQTVVNPSVGNNNNQNGRNNNQPVVNPSVGNNNGQNGRNNQPVVSPNVNATKQPVEKLTSKERATDNEDETAPPIKELVQMSGSLEVNHFTGNFTDTGEPIFQTLGVEQVGNHYAVTKKDWQVGDAFQLALTSNISGAYVYIVSVNPRNEAKIMFPRNEEYGNQYAGSHESPLMMLDGARALLPGTDKIMKVDYVGTDRICVLFSTRKIKGFPVFCKKIQEWKGNFDDYLHNLLGDIMIPMSDTNLSLSKVAFSISTRSDGAIVPIVIEFKSK
jgi:Papain family cysteine protease